MSDGMENMTGTVHNQPKKTDGAKMMLIVLIVLSLTLFGFLGLQNNGEKGISIIASDSVEGIKVTGKANIEIKPDLVSFNIGVETTEETSEKCSEKHTEISNKITSALKATGIAEENLETSGVNMRPHYEYETSLFGGTSQRVLKGYIMTTTIKVKAYTAEEAGELIGLALDNGANTIGNLNYGLRDEQQVYAQALEKAMIDSNIKAQALAKTSNSKVGKPVSIVEGYSYNGGYTGTYRTDNIAMDSMESAKASIPMAIESGMVNITAEVSVVYEIK